MKKYWILLICLLNFVWADDDITYSRYEIKNAVVDGENTIIGTCDAIKSNNNYSTVSSLSVCIASNTKYTFSFIAQSGELKESKVEDMSSCDAIISKNFNEKKLKSQDIKAGESIIIEPGYYKDSATLTCKKDYSNYMNILIDSTRGIQKLNSSMISVGNSSTGLSRPSIKWNGGSIEFKINAVERYGINTWTITLPTDEAKPKNIIISSGHSGTIDKCTFTSYDKNWNATTSISNSDTDNYIKYINVSVQTWANDNGSCILKTLILYNQE